jgi:asparagine synthase (glutamine-hydrolysing)
LRAELIAAGEHFHGDSDTEVLLRLFERDGERCLDRLVGMFAFAIWEPRSGRLFLARDRLGKKPLYYWRRDRRLAFGSEIKALMTLPEIARSAKPDPLAMSDFLSLGYILSPKTAFADIRRLPAAHFAWFRPDGGAWSEHEYWRLNEHFLAERLSYGPALREQFSTLLDDAVRVRLRSDVPVGVFLSGGLDSSAVAAKVAASGASEVRAFCVGFEDKSFDEAGYARAVAEHVGIPLTLLDNPAPATELVSRLIWQCDEPFADTSMMPTYLLNRQARAHVTVALTGDGADEILAGYPTYRANDLYRFSRHLPRVLTRHLSAAPALSQGGLGLQAAPVPAQSRTAPRGSPLFLADDHERG